MKENSRNWLDLVLDNRKNRRMEPRFGYNAPDENKRVFTLDNGEELKLFVNLVTANVDTYKNSIIVVINHNSCIFVKQAKEVYLYDAGVNAWMVSFNPSYCKIYTFKKDFENFVFDESEEINSVDELVKLAESQTGMPLRHGHKEYAKKLSEWLPDLKAQMAKWKEQMKKGREPDSSGISNAKLKKEYIVESKYLFGLDDDTFRKEVAKLQPKSFEEMLEDITPGRKSYARTSA